MSVYKYLFGNLHSEFTSQYHLMETHKVLLSHMLSKHFNTLIPTNDFIVVEPDCRFFDDLVEANPELEQPVYINNLHEHSMSFYTPIYRHSSGKGLVLNPDHIRFDIYYKRVIEFMLTFYEDVEFLYVADCDFEYWLSDNVNILYTPTIRITKKYIKVRGFNPKQDIIKKQPRYMRFDQFNFGMGHSVHYLEVFFDKYNEYIVPRDCDFELNIDTPIEKLREQLLLVAMFII